MGSLVLHHHLQAPYPYLHHLHHQPTHHQPPFQMEASPTHLHLHLHLGFQNHSSHLSRRLRYHPDYHSIHHLLNLLHQPPNLSPLSAAEHGLHMHLDRQQMLLIHLMCYLILIEPTVAKDLPPFE